MNVSNTLTPEQIAAYADKYRPLIPSLMQELADLIVQKDVEYDGSWLTREGHVFPMYCRKWDRMIALFRQRGSEDVLAALVEDKRSSPIEDDIVDLIGYLILTLAHYRANLKPKNAGKLRTYGMSEGMENPRGYDPELDNEPLRPDGSGYQPKGPASTTPPTNPPNMDSARKPPLESYGPPDTPLGRTRD